MFRYIDMNNLQKYQSLFNNAVEGLFQITLDRKFIDANRAMISLLGFDAFKNLQDETTDALAVCFYDKIQLSNIEALLDDEKELNNIEARVSYALIDAMADSVLTKIKGGLQLF